LSRLKNFECPTSASLLLNACCTLSTLYSGKPGPTYQQVEHFVPLLLCALDQVNQCNPLERDEIIKEVATCMSCISEQHDPAVVDLMMQHNVVKYVMDMIKEFFARPFVGIPALHCFGNICGHENNSYTDAVVEAGLLKYADRILSTGNVDLQKDMCWVMSNISASEVKHRAAILKTEKQLGLLVKLIDLSKNGAWKVRREALYTLCNLTLLGDEYDIRWLIAYGAIESFSLTLANCTSIPLMLEMLASLEKMLKMQGAYAYQKMDEADIVQIIEELQSHPNDKVYEIAYKIIDEYYCEHHEDMEADDENSPAVRDDGSQLLFGLPSTHMCPDDFKSPARYNFGFSGRTNSGLGVNSSLRFGQ
jgi:Atypical Arm repeat